MSLKSMIRKEVKELLTPSVIVPVVVISIVFAGMGSFMGGMDDEMEEKPVIALINRDTGVHAEMAVSILEENADIIYEGDDMNEAVEIMKEEGGSAVLEIPADFSWNIENNVTGTMNIVWIMKGVGVMDSIPSSKIDNLITIINQGISAELIQRNNDLDPVHVLYPTGREETIHFKGRKIEGVSPGTLSGMLSAQSIMVPIVTMMLIMMAGGIIISSMGMEKEDKTLETLLTLPVKRETIVGGKVIGAAVIGLIMAGIYMLGFGYYMRSFQFGEVNLAEYGLSLGTLDYVIVGLSLFGALLAGLSLSLVLGTYAENYKSAQSLLFPVTGLAMFPMFVFMFTDLGNLPVALQVTMLAIPFSHPIIAMRSLMFDDYLLVIGGIIYTFVFSGVMIFIAVRIFNSDRLITGKMTKKGGLLEKLTK
ncbi:MAG: ABC transporter permease [Thermoplasmata archaeon]